MSDDGPKRQPTMSTLTSAIGLFSNSGPEVKLSVNILAGFRVLSAVGAMPSA
jgi:hypothetical protein